MIEIEKTFLVRHLPSNLTQYPSDLIKQGYLSSSSTPLRIRQKGDKFELTKKTPLKQGDFSTAQEITILLDQTEFDKLWPLVDKSLEKTRYYIPLENGLKAELDVFQGSLKGLAFVEVEFNSTQEMDSFQPLDWFGRDVTQEDFSANAFLAGKTFSDISHYLS